jgi:hypothetical protein
VKEDMRTFMAGGARAELAGQDASCCAFVAGLARVRLAEASRAEVDLRFEVGASSMSCTHVVSDSTERVCSFD